MLVALLAAPPGPPSVAPDPMTAEDGVTLQRLLAEPPPVMETLPRVAPDGRRVVFVSTGRGPTALMDVTLGSDAAPRALNVKLPARFRRPGFTPDGRSLTFTADEHGDEAYAIYTLSLETGATAPLVAGEKLRRDGPYFAQGGTRLFFTARKMGDKGLFLYEQLPDASARLVFQSADVFLNAVRKDARQLLVTAMPRNNVLYAVDLPAVLPPGGPVSDAPRRLYPRADAAGGAEVQIQGVVYAPDAKRVFVLTDDGGERATLLAIDVKSGRILARYVDDKWPASKGQELQVGGDRVAFIVDAGTQHDVRILNARTLKPITITPPLPLGSSTPGAGHPNFSTGFDLAPDGKHLVFQWSTPASPARIHVIDTRTGERSPLVADATATPSGSPPSAPPATPLQTSHQTHVVQIPTFDALMLPTLVYLPAGASLDAPDRRRPVVVQMHGGFPFASTARFDAKVKALLDEGYIVVEPNVRGSGGFGRAFEQADDGTRKLDAFRDMGAVARFVAAQPWADPARLGLMGGSAGGYYTLIGLAHDPDIWRCGIAVVPMVDVEASLRTTDGDLREFWENRELVPLSEPMLLRAMSPSTWVDRIKAPLLLFAAARDARTPLAQIEGLARTQRERGIPIEYMLSSEGHSLDDRNVRLELLARTLRFLRTQCAAPAPR